MFSKSPFTASHSPFKLTDSCFALLIGRYQPTKPPSVVLFSKYMEVVEKRLWSWCEGGLLSHWVCVDHPSPQLIAFLRVFSLFMGERHQVIPALPHKKLSSTYSHDLFSNSSNWWGNSMSDFFLGWTLHLFGEILWNYCSGWSWGHGEMLTWHKS